MEDRLSKYDGPSERERKGQEFVGRARRRSGRWRPRAPSKRTLATVRWGTEDLEFAAARNAGRDEPLVIVRLNTPNPLFGFGRPLEAEYAAWLRRPERPPGYDESLAELKRYIGAGRAALLEAVSL